MLNNIDQINIFLLMTKDFWVKVKKEIDWTSDFVNGWKRFFKDSATHKIIFTRVESRENLVILIGYALWSEDSKEEDYCIWTATIENDLVVKWQIYEDIEDKRKKFNIT